MVTHKRQEEGCTRYDILKERFSHLADKEFYRALGQSVEDGGFLQDVLILVAELDQIVVDLFRYQIQIISKNDCVSKA